MEQLGKVMEVLGWTSFLWATGLIFALSFFVPTRSAEEVDRIRGSAGFASTASSWAMLAIVVAVLLLTTSRWATSVVPWPDLANVLATKGFRLGLIAPGLLQGIWAYGSGAYGFSDSKLSSGLFVLREDFARLPVIATVQIVVGILAIVACVADKT